MNLQTFLAYLGLLFIGLQLTHSIAWPWWIVTLPLWILPAIQFTIGFVVSFFAALKVRRAKRNT